MKRSSIQRFFGAALFAICASTSFGQTGQFLGQITDPQNAAVPNAIVQVVNLDTMVRRETKTNETGSYVVPFVQPGKYQILVQTSNAMLAQANLLPQNLLTLFGLK